MIELIDGKYESFKFPAGEIGIRVTEYQDSSDIRADIKNSDDVMTLLLLCDSLRRMNADISTIYFGYLPYGRQDRVCNNGESFSLKVFADLINSIGARHVVIVDPHSDVTPALINNCRVFYPIDPIRKLLTGKTLICPDAGAEKRIAKLKTPYVLATKNRDTKTGEITGTTVHTNSLANQTCIIIDDICDGGRTFIELAKVLRSKGASVVELYVSHGIFSKGLEVFDGLIDKIYTYNFKTRSIEQLKGE